VQKIKYKLQPWDHVLEAVELACMRRAFAFFMETGTGKTSAAIHTLRHWWTPKKRIGRTLIFCPSIVRHTWKKEFKKHSDIPMDRVTVLDQTGDKRAAMMQEIRETGKGQVVVTNFEGLRMSKLLKQMTAWKPEYIIFDEIHRLKNPKSVTSRAAFNLANPNIIGKGRHQVTLPRVRPPRKLILTGTPVLNNLMDLFQQFAILDGGKTFGLNFYIFRARYFYDVNSKKRALGQRNAFPLWVMHNGADKEINKILKKTSIHKEKMKCLDIPALTQQNLEVGMVPEQKRMYEELARDFVTTMGDDVVMVDLALVQGTRLMQIVSGYYVNEDGEEKEYKDTPKLAALKERAAPSPLPNFAGSMRVCPNTSSFLYGWMSSLKFY